MTTKEFIRDNFDIASSKVRRCSSVFADYDGNIYSYGHHYPLLFRVGGKTIRNVRGYSNTTGRHIMWSRDVDAIDVHTLSKFRLNGDDSAIMAELIRGQQQWIDSINQRINHHREMGRREDTGVFGGMTSDLAKAQANLARLEA